MAGKLNELVFTLRPATAGAETWLSNPLSDVRASPYPCITGLLVVIFSKFGRSIAAEGSTVAAPVHWVTHPKVSQPHNDLTFSRLPYP